MNTDQLIIDISNRIHDLTLPKCGLCIVPHSCCHINFCDEAQAYALREYNTDISNLRTSNTRLPFMSEKGCVVPNHLKPTCTIHVCAQHLYKDKRFDDIYLRLRNVLSYLLYRRSRDNPNSKISMRRINDQLQGR